MGPGDDRPVRTRRIENVGHFDEKPLAAEVSDHLAHPALSTSDGVPLVRLDRVRLRIDEVSEDVVFSALEGAAHFDARDESEGGFGRGIQRGRNSRHGVMVGDGQNIDRLEGGSETFFVAGGVLKVEGDGLMILAEYGGASAPEELPAGAELDSVEILDAMDSAG